MNVKLVGSFVKHIDVELSPGEEFFAERGAMMFADEGIDFSTELIGRSLGKLLGAAVSGESLALVRFMNRSGRPGRLGVGAHSGLLHIKLENYEILTRRGAYVASSRRVDISSKLSIAGLVGGMGAVLQRVSGSGATVFLQCYGEAVAIDLPPGKTMRLDEQHIVALVGIDEQRVSANWSAQNIFGGEGLSLLSVTGPGRVYLNP